MVLMLLSLPDKSLLEIMVHLPKKDLCNLAMVSSRITGPAQSVLYRSIYLHLQSPRNSYLLTRLVNTLSQKPHLRLSVSTLSIGAINLSYCDHFNDYESLLSLVPRLQVLSLEPPPAHLQLSNFSLPILETLSFNFDHMPMDLPTNERKDPIEIIARHFWIPQLQRMHVNNILFTPEMGVLFPADCHRTSSIAHLEFTCSIEDWRSGVGLSCLPNILLCIKKLESFTLEFYTGWEVSDSYINSMEPWEIGQLLHIHTSTLVRLEIAASDSAKFSQTSLIGSLAGYTKLKILAIPEPFLVITRSEFGTLPDVLPPNIEELQLQFPMFKIPGEDKYRGVRIKRLVSSLSGFALLTLMTLGEQISKILNTLWDDDCGDTEVCQLI